jgi:hypothetical protein
MPASSPLTAIIAALTALLIPLSGVLASANLLENSSFELGLRGGWNVYGYTTTMKPDEPTDAIYIDATTAADGKSSVHLDHRYNSLKYRPVRLTQGGEYTLSLSLKARPGLAKCPQVLVQFAGQQWWFSTTPEWRRQTVAFTATSLFEGTAWLAIHPLLEADGGDGPIWVDAVQIEPGSAVLPYAPAAPVEFGLHSAVPCNVFHADEPLRLRLAAYNATGEARTEVVQFRVVDSTEAPVWRERLTLACPPGVSEHWVTPRVGRLGSFRADCESATGQWAPLVFARFPRTDPGLDAGHPLGVHAPLDPLMLASAQRLGYKWVRLHDFAGAETKWPAVEPQPGELRWGDATVDLARSYGLTPIALFDLGAPWTKEGRTPEETAQDLPNMRAWRNYVYQTVSHYKGRIDHFELLNESPNYPPYVELCKAAWEETHRANPAAQVLAPCLWDLYWPPHGNRGSELLAQGVLKYTDIWTFHYFVKTAELLDGLVAAGRSDGKQRPVWNTEDNCGCFQTLYTRWANNWGDYWSDLDIKPARSPQEQADFISQSIAASLGHGIAKSFFYQNSLNQNLVPQFRSNSTREYDGAPRPVEVAHAASGYALNGAKPLGEPQPLKGIRTVVFEKGGHGLLVIWTEGLPIYTLSPRPDRPHASVPPTSDPRLIQALRLEHLPGSRTARLRKRGAAIVELPVPAAAVTIRDCMLNRVEPLPGSTNALLPVSYGPLFVEVAGWSGKQLERAVSNASIHETQSR